MLTHFTPWFPIGKSNFESILSISSRILSDRRDTEFNAGIVFCIVLLCLLWFGVCCFYSHVFFHLKKTLLIYFQILKEKIYNFKMIKKAKTKQQNHAALWWAFTMWKCLPPLLKKSGFTKFLYIVTNKLCRKAHYLSC